MNQILHLLYELNFALLYTIFEKRIIIYLKSTQTNNERDAEIMKI